MTESLITPTHFTLFGFTHDLRFFTQVIPDRLGITPHSIKFGSHGCLFYYSTYGQVAQTPQAIALALGNWRRGHTSLSADTLLSQNIIHAAGIAAPETLAGNGSVAWFSLTHPEFWVYSSLLSVYQFQYTQLPAGIIFADNFSILTRVLPSVNLNPRAIPLHFLFRLTPGPITYYEGVHSLCPGQLFRWTNGRQTVTQACTLNNLAPKMPIAQPAAQTTAQICHTLKAGLQLTGPAATLLSGGVDSSLIQLALNQIRTPEVLRSYSFSMLTPAYQTEIDYAAQAGQALNTNHTAIKVSPGNYLELLEKTIETVGHPSLCIETDPCLLALANHLQQHVPGVGLFFVGHGADALFGLPVARKLWLYQFFRRIPASRWILPTLGGVLQRVWPNKGHGLREIAAMITHRHCPNSFEHPLNRVATYTDLSLARRCFGDEPLLKAFQFRQEYARQYLNSADLLEQAHTINLLTWDFEAAVFGSQLFLACGKEKLYPFLDQAMIQMAYSIAPTKRYIKQGQVKYLLKELLAQNSLAAIAQNAKRGGTFQTDLFAWMKNGPLTERVRSINRPGFISQTDFERLLSHPSPFLWELLIFDIFEYQHRRRSTMSNQSTLL